MPGQKGFGKVLPAAPGQKGFGNVLPAVPEQKGWQKFGLAKDMPATPAGSIRFPIPADAAAGKRLFADATGNPNFKRLSTTRADGVEDVIYNIIPTPYGLDDVYLTDSFVLHVLGQRDTGNNSPTSSSQP